MSIEDNISKIAAALEAIAAGQSELIALLSSAAAAPPAEAEKATTSRGSTRQRKNQEREDKPADPVEQLETTPPEPEPDPLDEVDPLDAAPAEEPETFTEDQVRKALKNYREINGATATMSILKDNGATGMGDLKPEKYAAVMRVIR